MDMLQDQDEKVLSSIHLIPFSVTTVNMASPEGTGRREESAFD